jgi:cell division protease FtsH
LKYIKEGEEMSIIEFGYSNNATKVSDSTVVCTVEVKEASKISNIIENYRGTKYVNERGGSYGERYSDILSEGIYGFWIKKDNRHLYPSYHHNSDAIVFEGVDIRRVVAHILLEGVEVTAINIQNESYIDIDGISSENGRIVFDAMSGGDKVKVCIPINLNNKKSNISRKSTEGFYVLNKGTEQHLQIYQSSHTVYDKKKYEWESNYPLFTVDLFYGKINYNGKLRKGLFYYYQRELVSKYAIEKDDENKYILSDIRYSFYNDSKQEYKITNKGNKVSFIGGLKTNEEIIIDENLFKEFLEETYIDAKSTNDFKIKFEGAIVEEIKYPIKGIYKEYDKDAEKNIEYLCKKVGKTYSFALETPTPIYYLVELNERKNIVGSDYSYMLCDRLGDLKIEENNSLIRITLSPQYNDWVIEYCDGEKSIKVTYKVLSQCISQTIIIPSIPHSNEYPVRIIKSWIQNEYKSFITILREVNRLSSNKKTYEFLLENSLTSFGTDYIKIKQILFPAPNVINDTVVKQVYEAMKTYTETGILPNFAIMGGPGTGKSTLVKRISECFMGKSTSGSENVIFKSTSDLKGAYIGQTAARVFDLLKEAAEKEQIIFIDEAYNLQEDRFGQEALEMILPLLTGDREDIEKPAMGQKQTSGRYSFKEQGKKVPPIWLAGYEHEMRKMLYKNPGLYRRMLKLSLPAPSVNGLYENLLGKADNLYRGIIESHKDQIKNFFGWAISKEYVNYFGNFAGVNDFYQTCKVRLDENMSDSEKKTCVGEIIDEKKEEMKKQYKAILADIERIEFEIQSDIETTLEDVKGNEKVVSGLREIVSMLVDNKKYLEKGITIPKGMLLVGPPGTGKTLLARAVAGEVQKVYEENDSKETRVGFISTISTELDTPKKIAELFKEAEDYDTSVIFIDEIDAIGKHRNASGAVPTLLIQLMKEMDGFEERKNIFVMAASNAPNVLDPALKRPGRFDRLIEVSYPDQNGRKDIIKYYLQKLKIFSLTNVDSLVEMIAHHTVGYAPSELKNLINESAILYESLEKNNMNMYDNKCIHRKDLIQDSSDIQRFEKDIIEMIERQKVGEINSENREKEFQTQINDGCSSVAIHEVGHALVSVLLEIDPFEKITIISRGDALGYVSPSSKSKLNTKRKFLNQIKVCLGGRVAEELFYGDDISTGAVVDIQQATKYAENMLTLYGMSDLIGPMAVKIDTTNYLESKSVYTCSDTFRYEIDDAIRKLLSEQMSITRNMLERYKDIIEKLAEYIFKEETVTGDDFIKKYKEIIKGIIV